MADNLDNIEDLLIEWGFTQYVDKFAEEEVTLSCLQHMSDSTLATIVPKAGPRSVLQLKVQQYYGSMRLNERPLHQQLITSTPRSASSVNVSSFGNCSATEFSFPFSNAASVATSHNPVLQSSASSSFTSVLPIENVEDGQINIDEGTEIQPTASTTDQRMKTTINIEEIVGKHALGTSLLKSKRLDVNGRTLLTDIVANHMLVNISGRITREQYQEYAAAIVSAFPRETQAIYYIPSTEQQTPKGKLYCRVTHLLAKLRDLNGTRGIRTVQKDKQGPAIQMEHIAQGDINSVSDWTSWLLINSGPESRVLQLWRETAKSRLSFIHLDGEPLLPEILTKWPRYKDDNGYLLINEDFCQLHPGKGDQMSIVWPHLSGKMVPFMCRSKDREARAIQAVMCGAESADNGANTRMACVLLLLPSLLSEPAVATLSVGKSRKRAFWKPTAAESMVNFIDLQQPGLDLLEYIKMKEETLNAKGLQLQPHVIVLCEDSSDLSNCVVYAVIGKNLVYEMNTILSAVDTCFKACFVFNLNFSQASQSSWLFIQRAVFNISTRNDLKNSKVLQLLADCSSV